MKRQIMKSLMALCAGAMTLCAASSLFTSCDKFDDTLLKQEIESLKGELTDLDGRVKAIEDIKATLEALTAKVDALYTLKFQVVTETNELQYSFDNGTTWKTTGIILAEECDAPCECVPVDPCSCPEVSLVDNGDSVTITVGEAEFTIEKPEEIEFEIKAGKVYFAFGGTQEVKIQTSGIEDVSVLSAPKGWSAEITSDGKVSITAPAEDDLEVIGVDYDTYQFIYGDVKPTGIVKLHACTADGKCIVGKINVEASDDQIVIKAYGGKYTVAPTGEGMAFYGISTKDKYLSEAQVLLDAFTDLQNEDNYNTIMGWENMLQYDSAEGTIAELLGSEPEKGVEYVIWAVLFNTQTIPTENDIVLAYYTPISVDIVEDATKTTPYDVYLSVDVTGADSYYAVPLADTWNDGDYSYIDGQIAEMVENVTVYNEGNPGYGKLMKGSFEGYLYSIPIATGYMTEYINGSPNQLTAIAIMPIDGRPVTEYTADDFYVYKTQTKALTSGGSVTATPVQVYTDQSGRDLNKYTQLGVELTEITSDDWSRVYFDWMTPADYALVKDDDELIVDWMLKRTTNNWATKDDFAEIIKVDGLKPLDERVFISFFVDEDGKYGEIMELTLSTPEVSKATIAMTVTTSATDDVIANTTDLVVTPSSESTISKYRYIRYEITDTYNPYANYTNDKWFEELYFESNVIPYGSSHYTGYVVEVAADKLSNGTFTSKQHAYGSRYIMAILPFDADGTPGKDVTLVQYNCKFELANLITSGDDFTSTKPAVTLVENPYKETDSGTDYHCILYEQAYDYYNYEYKVRYNVTVPTGVTEVRTALVEPVADAESGYEVSATDVEKATGLWMDSLDGVYNIKTFKATGIASARYLYDYGAIVDGDGVKTEDGYAALTPYVLVTWKDASNNYYFTTVSFETEFATMFNTLETKRAEKEAAQDNAAN